MARPQSWPRLLRLSRPEPGADPLIAACRLVLALALAAFLAVPAGATDAVRADAAARAAASDADPPCFDAPFESVVEDAIDAVTLRLANGRMVRLADLRPLPAPGPNDGRAEALSRTRVPSREADGVAGVSVTVRPVAGAEPDRYGRLPADVVRKDTGSSLRVDRLVAGLALVDPLVMSEECLSVAFRAERAAEAARRGHWARGGPVAAASDADLVRFAGRYVIVEGRVRSVGARRTVYLNFGDDWATDFTAMGDSAALGAVVERDLQGRTVRVRGVLDLWNGGVIRIEHPAQVQVLPASR